MSKASLSEARLKVLRAFLGDGRPQSTKNIAKRTGILLISAHIEELRNRGIQIVAERHLMRGKHVLFYRLQKELADG